MKTLFLLLTLLSAAVLSSSAQVHHSFQAPYDWDVAVSPEAARQLEALAITRDQNGLQTMVDQHLLVLVPPGTLVTCQDESADPCPVSIGNQEGVYYVTRSRYYKWMMNSK